ncbi:hypothetical protein HN51_030670 [Arachis hypogaea]
MWLKCFQQKGDTYIHRHTQIHDEVQFKEFDELCDTLKMKKPHSVMVPFPSQGHINPFLKPAKILHTKGFHITFVNRVQPLAPPQIQRLQCSQCHSKLQF